LTYNSDTVEVRPVVQVALSSGSNDPVPTSISADLTFNGVDSGPVQFSVAGHNPGGTYLLAVQDPTAITASGNYAWSMTVTVKTSGGSTPLILSGTMSVGIGAGGRRLADGTVFLKCATRSTSTWKFPRRAVRANGYESSGLDDAHWARRERHRRHV
jgi:hypothetical protein